MYVMEHGEQASSRLDHIFEHKLCRDTKPTFIAFSNSILGVLKLIRTLHDSRFMKLFFFLCGKEDASNTSAKFSHAGSWFSTWLL